MYTSRFLSKVRASNIHRAGLALAAAAALAAVAPAAARAEDVIAHSGLWTVVTVPIQGGGRACGIATRMDRGGTLSIYDVNGEYRIQAWDPSWHVRTGGTYAVTVAFDQDRYSGDGRATDNTSIEVFNVKDELIDAIAAGDEVTMNFGGVIWTLDLSGTDDAVTMMRGCSKIVASEE